MKKKKLIREIFVKICSIPKVDSIMQIIYSNYIVLIKFCSEVVLEKK